MTEPPDPLISDVPTSTHTRAGAGPIRLKLATWNLALPVSEARHAAMREHTDREQADVWVLTETHDTFTPGHAYSHSSAAGRDGDHGAEHRWVTTWSRHPLEPLETADAQRTAAARVRPASGAPFIVYGTVLPWVGSAWRGHPSVGGAAFRAALAVQAADWAKLRLAYPGDGGPGDPVRRDSAPAACIDHVCARRDSAWQPVSAVRWPDEAVPPRWLSDHFGVSVVFTGRT